MKKEKGSITLEACVSLIMFVFLMLFWSGLMVMYNAQGDISHALLQTAESMSLDPYAIEKLNASGVEEDVTTWLSHFIAECNASEPYFATSEEWYTTAGATHLPTVAKNRFIGYFTNGDETKAEDLLKYFKVSSDITGLDFSESEVVDGDLLLTVKYNLEYQFNIKGLLNVPMKQTVRVKLLK